jgi:hypothetical protein
MMKQYELINDQIVIGEMYRFKLNMLDNIDNVYLL